jgi:DNA-directed RNA polymerase subunit E'/Rpb7
MELSSLELISPSKNIIQYTRIQIPPHMMNSDIEDNMNIVLQQKVEGKCNRYGFVEKVHNIEEYLEDIILPENFSGCATYKISYLCTIVIPIENTTIIGNIKAMNPELVIAVNGPIIIFIPKANIDTNIWDVSNDFTDKKKSIVLKQNDSVKIHLEKVKINQGDIQIKCIGRLLERVTDEEITEYFGAKKESNFII